jgi:hypothetical protein
VAYPLARASGAAKLAEPAFVGQPARWQDRDFRPQPGLH